MARNENIPQIDTNTKVKFQARLSVCVIRFMSKTTETLAEVILKMLVSCAEYISCGGLVSETIHFIA
jgi:hypothetical protein